MQLVTFAEVNLPVTSSDRVVWRFVQEQDMLLLTDNRNRKGRDSLERTIQEESMPSSRPVLTIGNLGRVGEHGYRQRCAERIVEIVLDLHGYLGAGRIFIP